MNTDLGGRCLNLLSVTPLRRTLVARDQVTHTRHFQIIVSTRTIFIYFFLARAFGNFHFIPCYLPLFPFDLIGLNLEFEPL